MKFKITEDRKEYLEYSSSHDPHEACGYSDTFSQRILLDAKQGPDVKADTLLHEILHAIFSMTMGPEVFTDDQEEQIIMTLSSPLLDVLRRNPKVVDYLMERNG